MPKTLSLSLCEGVTSEMWAISGNLVEIAHYSYSHRGGSLLLSREELEAALKLLDEENVEVEP